MLITRSLGDQNNLHDDISELYHYTNAEGLRGILTSGSLWATHYRDLNDSSEIDLLRPHFQKTLYKRLLPNIGKARIPFSWRRKIRKHGGIAKVACDESELFTRILYEQTFGGADNIPFGVPFISSFCSHVGDSMYERKNGLLSQWRAYANGGFCIVFDTKPLVRMLKDEVVAYEYGHFEIGPVRYFDNVFDIEKLVPGVIQRCLEWETLFMQQDNDNRDIGSMGDVFNEFVSAAALLKHQGFREEREVRIVAAPMTAETVQELRKEYSIESPLSLKNIHITNNGHARRHIRLFENSSKRLPILRIIIGPARDQEENYQLAKSIMQLKNIHLIRSKTPYLG